jgi:hypothetical protein
VRQAIAVPFQLAYVGGRKKRTMSRTGRCLCGKVRYELDGELPPLVNCHCQFCRRAHGAAFVTIAWVPSSSFRFTAGANLVHRSSDLPQYQTVPPTIEAARKEMKSGE